MCNAASLLLPGSNLTNLLVLSSEHRSGADFAAGMWPAWAASILVTIVVVACWPRRVRATNADLETRPVQARVGVGGADIAASTLLMLVDTDPAVLVLGVGVAAVAVCVVSGRFGADRAVAAIDPAI